MPPIDLSPPAGTLSEGERNRKNLRKNGNRGCDLFGERNLVESEEESGWVIVQKNGFSHTFLLIG